MKKILEESIDFSKIGNYKKEDIKYAKNHCDNELDKSGPIPSRLNGFKSVNILVITLLPSPFVAFEPTDKYPNEIEDRDETK